MIREVENDLFPHSTAGSIGQKVDLIHDHVGQAIEGRRFCVNHIAQHLGGHDDDLCIRVDRYVTGEQAYGLFAMLFHQVVVLLVAQGFNWRRIKALGSPAQRQRDSKFAHDGFAGAGRRADQYTMTVLHGLAALYLELIQRVWQGCGKRIQMSFSHDSPGYPCLEDIVEKAAAGRRSPTGAGAPCLLRLLLCLLYWL